MIMIVGTMVFPIPRDAAIVAVHKSGHSIRKSHDADPLHPRIDDCFIGGKQRKELMPKKKQQKTKDDSRQ